MRTSKILALSLVLFSGCDTSEPEACKEMLRCCEALAAELAPQCRSAYDQALEQGSQEAERLCQSAIAGFEMAGGCEAPTLPTLPGTDGGSSSSTSDLPASQGLSEPCNPDYGLDACGAGLFCAAFDGRSVPTCYAEGVRASGQSCTEDRQCTLGACAVDAGICRAGSGQSCTLEAGCADDDQVCATLAVGERACTDAGDGRFGELCANDTHCQGGLVCANQACRSSGEEHALCQYRSDCHGLLECVGSRCEWGRREGSACESNEHCSASLVCSNATCQRAPGGACQVSAPDCLPGEYCQLTSANPEAAQCMPEGLARLGEICARDACSGGTTCLGFSGFDARCHLTCPASDDTCDNGDVCFPTSLSFGLCLEEGCSPFSCGPGQTCTLTIDLDTRELFQCQPAGNVLFGGSCASSACAGPGLCADVGDGPTCYEPCDRDHDCASGSCIYLPGVSFGTCY